ncbi:NADP-dependent oxidoreductase domain-containing protein [Mycena rebaudengoi]|nr:NADP-dependent oxidoreductase domain-containing protein [Mycena rebaudengoi]
MNIKSRTLDFQVPPRVKHSSVSHSSIMSSSMPLRKLNDAKVSAIGYGAMGLSGFYGDAVKSDEERFKVLDAAHAKGSTFWDTADIYNDNEELIGKWFKRTGKRDDIFIATKFGIWLKDNRMINGDPDYVRQATENSLKKLGVSTIDLMYFHRADTTLPIEVTVRALAELVKEGKIRYIGLSEVSAATIRRAHAVHPIAAVEVEYSPFNLEIEDPQIGVLKVCRELGIAIVAYSPLGRGILTGRINPPPISLRATSARRSLSTSDENFPNILKLADGLKEIGARHGATGGQVALAWLLSQGDDIIPIPGTKTIKYMDENLGALKVKLTSADLELIRDYIEKSNANKGDRYPAWGMGLAYLDTPELK